MNILFKANIWKSGTSYVITIPFDFVENNVLKTNKEYEFEIKGVDKNAGNKRTS